MKRLGKPGSKAVLVAYTKDTVLPEADGRRYKMQEYIPWPLRCMNCQRFGHHHSDCTNSTKCSTCGENHTHEQCINKDKPKCVNCSAFHSAAYRGCPKYIETQTALRIRTLEKLTYSEALKLKPPQTNTTTETNNHTLTDSYKQEDGH